MRVRAKEYTKWPEWIAARERDLKRQAAGLGLTAHEQADPEKYLRQWPRPRELFLGKGKAAPLLTGERASVFEEVYYLWYSNLSALAHQRLAAAAQAYLSDDPDSPWAPEWIASNIVTSTLLFMACILSEIEVAGEFEPNVHLRALWARLGPVSDVTERLLSLRYRRVLKL
jgi:hypothetical protein